jgi:hypothetical protein
VPTSEFFFVKYYIFKPVPLGGQYSAHEKTGLVHLRVPSWAERAALSGFPCDRSDNEMNGESYRLAQSKRRSRRLQPDTTVGQTTVMHQNEAYYGCNDGDCHHHELLQGTGKSRMLRTWQK